MTVTRKTVAQSHISWQGRNNTHLAAVAIFYPGAHRAPQRNPVSISLSLFPSTPPHHPHPEPWRGTLTPHPGAHPGASAFASYSGTNTAVSHTICGKTDSAPRNGIPASETRSGGRDGVWDTGRGHQPMGIKRGPWSISKTLEKYYVIPPACASGLVRQAVRFLTNCHTGTRSFSHN